MFQAGDGRGGVCQEPLLDYRQAGAQAEQPQRGLVGRARRCVPLNADFRVCSRTLSTDVTQAVWECCSLELLRVLTSIVYANLDTDYLLAANDISI